jgi:hypothetical protein
MKSIVKEGNRSVKKSRRKTGGSLVGGKKKSSRNSVRATFRLHGKGSLPT